ncbi:MAG: hypothetical protein J5I53_01090 [Bradyrhizobiaceae bacterium]|nr:hypothetical protein [Bradyrhizobiaceae bacterium]
MVMFLCCVLVATSSLYSQTVVSTSAPIVLEWADSLVGSGGPAGGIREFFGNVRLRQGNVSVRCDRAIHDPARNTADLFGNVRVVQDALIFESPQARYDGNAHLATGTGGISIRENNRTVKASSGTYSTTLRFATFTGKVHAVDDTALIWSDNATYSRESKQTHAWGNVVVWDTVGLSRLRADSLLYHPRASLYRLMGNAACWDWDSTQADTTYIIADTLERNGVGEAILIGKGAVEFVHGPVAARADSMMYDQATGKASLVYDPVLWSNEMELLADTIQVRAPDQQLSTITGIGHGMLVSRQDSLHPERFDQIAGRLVRIDVAEDTVRQITAIENARSITFRYEEHRGEGVAVFTADSIKATFEHGELTDVYWLTGVEGNHQPEHLVAGQEGVLRLPNFEWRLDKPIAQPLPIPDGPVPTRTPLRKKENNETAPRMPKKP